jgi:heme/copper-type cytochrome/quinol oxidase subunit 1
MMKKYAYPIAFALARGLFYLLLGWALTQVDADSRAARMMLSVFSMWVLVPVPLFCMHYSGLIQKEKAKIGFAVYNCIVLTLGNMRFSDSVVKMVISFVLVGAWVTLFTFVLPILHAKMRARMMKTLENEEKGQ